MIADRLWLTWSRRGALTLAVALLLCVVLTQVAAADVIGQAPPAFSWIELKDSHGISAWNYEMSLDRGGITDPGKFFWAAVVDFSWSLYWGSVVLAIWFLDWVLAFDWVGLLASPIITIGHALQGVIDRMGLVPTLLTVATLIAVLLMVRGKWATGIWELAMTLVIASLATGVLAQPLDMLAGDNDGAIYTARNWGFELAGELSKNTTDGTSPSAEAMRQQLTGTMVDTFVRQPAEMINFGQIIDGGKCEATYDSVLKSGPHGMESTIRDKVARCDGGLGDYAANPAAGMATGSVLFAPAALVILALAVVIAGTVLLAGASVLWQGLKVIVHLVLGLLPGGFRGSLLLTITEALMSLILLGFSTVFLAVFMMIVQALFVDASGSQVPRAFVITDILLVIGLLVFLRTKKRIRATAHRLAEFLAQRPGTGAKPTRIPEGMNSRLGPTVAKMAGLGMSLAYLKGRRQPQPAGGPTLPPPAAGPTVRTAFSGSGQPPATPPPDSTPSPGGSNQGPTAPSAGSPPGGSTPTGAGGRVGGGLARVAARKLIGATVSLGTKVGATYLTGGAAAVLSAATTAAKARQVTRAARSAHRAALATQLGSGSAASAKRQKAPRPTASPPADTPGTGSGSRPRSGPPRRQVIYDQPVHGPEPSTPRPRRKPRQVIVTPPETSATPTGAPPGGRSPRARRRPDDPRHRRRKP